MFLSISLVLLYLRLVAAKFQIKGLDYKNPEAPIRHKFIETNGNGLIAKNDTSPWPTGRHFFTSHKENFELINNSEKNITTLLVTLNIPTPVNPNMMRQVKFTGPSQQFSLLMFNGLGEMITYVVMVTDDFIIEDYDAINHKDPLYSITGPSNAFDEVQNTDGSLTLKVNSPHSPKPMVSYLSIILEKNDFKREINKPSTITYYILFFTS
ncbi:hypothetical protein K502DRAFT_346213 [Neoconidiobolus thromboides FSU 785]|nr:hypothetical protein K502DRAFT_346213 [Neoconidiobolus thromboides FSU 785]